MGDIKHLPDCTCGTCPKPKFVQIHAHTDASLLDGVAKTKKMVQKAVEFGHPALVQNNHGNPSGLYTHYKECKKAGIKPILGLEFYMTNDLTSRVAFKNREFEDRDWHQSVFIKDKEGYVNFNYLTYVSFTDGFYYKPRIDYDLLFSKKEGLMVTTSCMASKINNYLTADEMTKAEDLFKRFLHEFGDDFYGEIQFNELNDRSQWGIDQRRNNQFVIDLCKKYGVPILIGGDVHYVEKEDNLLQDTIINSKRQAKEGEEGFQIHARHLYYHDVSDYYDFNKKFEYHYDTEFLEECFENSIKFAEKSNFDFETGKYHLPKIKMDGMDSNAYIEKVTWDGLITNIEKERKYFPDKYTNEDITKLEQQTEYELQVLKDMGLVDYMLIVYDIIRFEKENNIIVGAGRGSAAGSCVAWALGITGLNPLEHGLLFERFVNPNRKVMADIDWDQEMGAREKVLEYLVGTYGADHVCNVATFGTYGAKSALADMSRGLRKNEELVKILNMKITKLPQMDDVLNPIKDLISYFDNIKKTTKDNEILYWIENNQDTIDYANKVLGSLKSLGTHAGGIVVTPEPIYNLIPVTRGSGNLITAFSEADGSAKDLSELGILKLDVLGLSTLNIFKECIERIKEDTGLDLSEKINHLPLDDKKMINFFATGNNYGIFQMDRSAMFTNRFATDGAAVDSFEDIVAINAMNRPGPLEKFLPKYGYWKAVDQGKIEVSPEELKKIDKERYPFEFMRNSLEATYGCLLFQEQFMQMICDVTGMSFGDADSFRRAIAWKVDNPKYYTVKGYFDRLEESMIQKGYTKEDVDKFVQYCRDFMGYSFNKCVSGDTIFLRKKNQHKQRTVGEWYKAKKERGWARRNKMLTHKKQMNRLGWGKTYSMDERFRLTENEIVDIRFEGEQEIFRVTTSSGAYIDVTSNHKFPTSNGEKRLDEIDINKDQLYVLSEKVWRDKYDYPTMREDIVSIESRGIDEVYDVEMHAPYHNFAVSTGIVTSNSHSVAYSYISWQTLYFKVYYPEYFYSAMLNMEDKTEKIQEIIEDARKNGVEVLPISVIKSEYHSKPEGERCIRLGYRLIKGLGESVEEELKVLKLHECKTIDEVLQKPFKKLNSSTLQNLIDIGCFDEFGVDRSMIIALKNLYKEPKIDTWFTRKRSPAEAKTMPEMLKTMFDEEVVMSIVPDIIEDDNPKISLINRLIPHMKMDDKSVDKKKAKVELQKATIMKEIQLMGFAVSMDDAFNDFARAMRSDNIISISEWREKYDNDPDFDGQAVYFKIVTITELKTKQAKPYWQYVLNDGRMDFKMKVWRENKKVFEGAYAIGAINYDRFGYTLSACEVVK